MTTTRRPSTVADSVCGGDRAGRRAGRASGTTMRPRPGRGRPDAGVGRDVRGDRSVRVVAGDDATARVASSRSRAAADGRCGGGRTARCRDGRRSGCGRAGTDRERDEHEEQVASVGRHLGDRRGRPPRGSEHPARSGTDRSARSRERVDPGRVSRLPGVHLGILRRGDSRVRPCRPGSSAWRTGRCRNRPSCRRAAGRPAPRGRSSAARRGRPRAARTGARASPGRRRSAARRS